MVEGADQNDFALTAGSELIDEVVAFLGDALPDDNRRTVNSSYSGLSQLDPGSRVDPFPL